MRDFSAWRRNVDRTMAEWPLSFVVTNTDGGLMFGGRLSREPLPPPRADNDNSLWGRSIT